MANEQRCPMCGKPNPAGAETCQFCQARLKPLIMGSSSEPSGASPTSGGSGQEPVPDWLSGLRADDESGETGLGADLGDTGQEAESTDDVHGKNIQLFLRRIGFDLYAHQYDCYHRWRCSDELVEQNHWQIEMLLGLFGSRCCDHSSFLCLGA